MKPFFDDGRVALYHGDFREVLPSLRERFDVCLADPPYGETSLVWDRWVAGWPGLIRPALSPAASMWCFGSLRMFAGRMPDFADWQLSHEVVWEKHNGSSFHADRFKRVHELVAHFYPKGVRWEDVYKAPVMTHDATARTVYRKQRPPHTGHIEGGWYTSRDGGPRLMRSVIYVRSTHGEAVHPTQKPLGILTPLIEYACPPGGLVLSPFAGSGSDLLAARLLGRRAVGIEVNEAHCEAAAGRLAQLALPLAG